MTWWLVVPAGALICASCLGDEMRWLSEDPVKFTNWENSSFPSEPAPIDTCAVLHSNTGKWENVSCQDEVENGVVCETTQSKTEIFL